MASREVDILLLYREEVYYMVACESSHIDRTAFRESNRYKSNKNIKRLLKHNGTMVKQIKINRLRDVLPLFDGLRTLTEIGQMVEPKVAGGTVAKWVRELRKAGYTVNTAKKGKPKLKI